jgi:hypothetical protein
VIGDWEEIRERSGEGCEMKLTVLCLFAALTAGVPSTTEHLPVTDAEKTADALRGGWNGTYIIHLPGPDQADQWFLVIPVHQADRQ